MSSNHNDTLTRGSGTGDVIVSRSISRLLAPSNVRFGVQVPVIVDSSRLFVVAQLVSLSLLCRRAVRATLSVNVKHEMVV
jgi:hypothetical protein